MNKVIIALILFILGINFLAYTYDDRDFQVWNTDVEEMKVNDDFKLIMEEEFRWGNNASELYYHHYDLGLGYTLNDNWSFKLSYRHILDRKLSRFYIQNEPNINATYKWSFLNLAMSNRSRLEYRHFDYQTDTWRYRNMTSITFPWKFTKYQLQPFIADDIFLSSKGATIHNNRLYVGWEFKIIKNLLGNIHYMVQHTRRVGKTKTNWPYANVFGIMLKMKF